MGDFVNEDPKGLGRKMEPPQRPPMRVAASIAARSRRMPADLDISPHARPCKSVSATGRERPGRRRAAKSVAHAGNSARMSISRWGRGKCEVRTAPTAGILAGGEKRRGESSEVMVSLTVAVVNSMSLL